MDSKVQLLIVAHMDLKPETKPLVKNFSISITNNVSVNPRFLKGRF